MNKIITVLTVAVLLIIAIGAYFFPQSGVSGMLGAAPGPEYTGRQYFDGGSTYGSGCFSTSTTGTLTAYGLSNGCITIAAAGAGQAAVSLTLPASTTMSSLIPKKGNCMDIFIDASGVAAATTTTIVAGAGHNVVGLDATGAGTGADVIDGAEYGRLTMCRENDGDVTTFVQEYINAD